MGLISVELLAAIQFRAEPRALCRDVFQQATPLRWLQFQLDLEIALSGDSARFSALGLLSSAEDALKRRVT